jgi:hypothetical protein
LGRSKILIQGVFVRTILITSLFLCLGMPAVASTHKFDYNMPCTALWPAVKDTIRNSGKYGILGIDSNEMTASYNIGGNLTGKRTNSLVLNTIPTGCELQVQTAYSGLVNNDAGDLKKRVDESLAKLAAAQPAAPAAPAIPATPAAPAAGPATPAPPAKN